MYSHFDSKIVYNAWIFASCVRVIPSNVSDGCLIWVCVILYLDESLSPVAVHGIFSFIDTVSLLFFPNQLLGVPKVGDDAAGKN